MGRKQAITIDVGFKVDIANLYGDMQKPLNKVIDLVEGSGISDAIKQEVSKSKVELQELFEDINKKYNSLMDGKIDSSEFDSFKKTTQNRLSELKSRIDELTGRFDDFQAAMSSIDASNAAQSISSLSQKFTEFRNGVADTNKMLFEFMQLANKKGVGLKFADSSNVSEIGEEFNHLNKMIDDFREEVDIVDEKDEKKIRKQLEDIGKSFSALKNQLDAAMKSGSSKEIIEITEQIYKQIQAVDSLRDAYENLTDKEYDFADIPLFKNNTGDNKNKRALWGDKYETYVEDFLKTMQTRRAKVQELMNKQTKETAGEIEIQDFSLKNGKIIVPVKIGTTEKALSEQVNKLLAAVQDTIEPIEVKFKLTSGYKKYRTDELKDAEELQNQINNLDIPNETKQNLQQLIGNIREAFGKELKINIRENSKEISQNVKDNLKTLQEELNNLPLKVSLVVDEESKKKLIKEIVDVISLTEGDSKDLNISEQAKALQNAVKSALDIHDIETWKESFLNSIQEIIKQMGNIKVPAGSVITSPSGTSTSGNSGIIYENDSVRGIGYHAGKHWEGNKFDFSQSGKSKSLGAGTGMYLATDPDQFSATYLKSAVDVKQVEYNLEKCFILTKEYISSVEDINKILGTNFTKETPAKEIKQAISAYTRASVDNSNNFRNQMLGMGYQGMYIGDYLANVKNEGELVIYDEAKLDKIISFTRNEFQELQHSKQIEINLKSVEEAKDKVDDVTKKEEKVVEVKPEVDKKVIAETIKPEEKQITVKVDDDQARTDIDSITKSEEKKVSVKVEEKPSEKKQATAQNQASTDVSDAITEKSKRLLNMMNVIDKLYQKSTKQEHAILFNSETGYSSNIKYGPTNRPVIPSIRDLLDQANGQANSVLHTHPGVNFARLDLKDIEAAIEDFKEGIKYNLVKAGNQIAIFNTEEYLKANIKNEDLVKAYQKTGQQAFDEYYKSHPEIYSYKSIIDKVPDFKAKLEESLDHAFSAMIRELNNGEIGTDEIKELKDALLSKYNEYYKNETILQNGAVGTKELDDIIGSFLSSLFEKYKIDKSLLGGFQDELGSAATIAPFEKIISGLVIPKDIQNQLMQQAFPKMLESLGVKNPGAIFKVTSQDKMLKSIYGDQYVGSEKESLEAIKEASKESSSSVSKDMDKVKQKAEETTKSIIDLSDAFSTLKSLDEIFKTTGGREGLVATLNSKAVTVADMKEIARLNQWTNENGKVPNLKKMDLAYFIADSYIKSMEEAKEQAGITETAIVDEQKSSGSADTSGIDAQTKALKDAEEQAHKTNEAIAEVQEGLGNSAIDEQYIKKYIQANRDLIYQSTSGDSTSEGYQERIDQLHGYISECEKAYPLLLKYKEDLMMSMPNSEEYNNAIRQVIEGSDILNDDIFISENELIKKIQQENKLVKEQNELFKERISYLQDGVVIATSFGTNKEAPGLPISERDGANAILHTHPDNNDAGGVFSPNDIFRFVKDFSDGINQFKLMWRDKILSFDFSDMSQETVERFAKIYAGLWDAIKIQLSEGAGNGDLTIPKELRSIANDYINKFAMQWLNQNGGNVSLSSIDESGLQSILEIPQMAQQEYLNLYNTILRVFDISSEYPIEEQIKNIRDAHGWLLKDKKELSGLLSTETSSVTTTLPSQIDSITESEERAGEAGKQMGEQGAEGMRELSKATSDAREEQEKLNSTVDEVEKKLSRPKKYENVDLSQMSPEELSKLEATAKRIINSNKTKEETKELWRSFLENDIAKENSRRYADSLSDESIVSETESFGELEKKIDDVTESYEESAKAEDASTEIAEKHNKALEEQIHLEEKLIKEQKELKSTRPQKYEDVDLTEMDDEELDKLKATANRIINNKRSKKETKNLWQAFLDGEISSEYSRRYADALSDDMIVSETETFGKQSAEQIELIADAHKEAAEAAKEHAQEEKNVQDAINDTNKQDTNKDAKLAEAERKKYEKSLAESIKQYSSITNKMARGKELTSNEVAAYSQLVTMITELNQKREDGIQLSDAEVKALNNVADANERALIIRQKEEEIQKEKDVKKQLNDYMKYEGQYMRLIGKSLHGTLDDYDEEDMSIVLQNMRNIEAQWNKEKAEGIELSEKQLEAKKAIEQRMMSSNENRNILEENALINESIKLYDQLAKKLAKMHDQSKWRPEGWDDVVTSLESRLNILDPKKQVYDRESFEEFKKSLLEIRQEAIQTQKSLEWRGISVDWQVDSKNKLYKWMQQNKKAAAVFREELERLEHQINEVENEADADTWNKSFLDIQNTAISQGLVGQTLGDRFRNQFANTMTSLATYYLSFQDFIRYGRQAIQVVRDLDTQLTEMRKVSDDSLQTLQKYQLETFDMAERVGTTAAQIQSSTADWLRLGKTLPDAAAMAELSTKLMNVSEFTDIKEATDALVSATQAYSDVTAGDIIDKLNYIGNNFAVSTDELAQGLQNAAAVLMTQGNDIDEALALLTAGNLITQDMSKASAGIRTISLRIAGTEEAKNELADLGEDIDDFVVRTKSKTDQIIRDYTAVASNNFKGVSVLTEEGNQRNTYDILRDIADVYKEIQETDEKLHTNRAGALVEELAGIVMPEII